MTCLLRFWMIVDIFSLLQTMCCILRVIFNRGNICDNPVQPVEMIMSFATSDVQMQLLLRTLTSILINEEVSEDEMSVSPPVLKSIALQNLLVLSTVGVLVE